MTSRRAFTLLELLVVMAIIAVLVGLLTPALEKATERSRVAACGSNLHQLAVALAAYGTDFNNAIPLGPGTPSTLDTTRSWNTIGSHQLRIGSLNCYDGMGQLLAGGWLSDARVFACPSDGDPSLKTGIGGQLRGSGDAYGSYAYRQLDQRSTSYLNTPGVNALHNPARALVLDWQSEGPAPFAHASHDTCEYLNVLYADGHIQYFPNDNRPLGASAADYTAMPASYLHRLDQVWVNADWVEAGSASTAPRLP